MSSIFFYNIIILWTRKDNIQIIRKDFIMLKRVFCLVLASSIFFFTLISCSEGTDNNPFVTTNDTTQTERNLKCTAELSTNPDPLEGCGSFLATLTCNVNHSVPVQNYYWEKSNDCEYTVIQTWTTTTNTLSDTLEHSYDPCSRGIYHYRCTVTFTDSSDITTNWVDAKVNHDLPINYVKISQSSTADQLTNDYENATRPMLELKMNRDITIDLSESIPDCDKPNIKAYMYTWVGSPNGAFEDPDYEEGTWQAHEPIFTFRKVSNDYGRVNLYIRTLSWDGGKSAPLYWQIQQ